VQAEAWEAEGIPRVRSGKEWYSGAEHRTDAFLAEVKLLSFDIEVLWSPISETEIIFRVQPIAEIFNEVAPPRLSSRIVTDATI
jgi:hypothetical protein